MTRLPYVPVTVEQSAGVDQQTAFDTIAPIDLTVVFKAWGPFPSVDGVTGQTGPWDTPGTCRRPRLGDGSTVVERLTEYTAPHSFAYELREFTGRLRHAVDHIRGEWTMTPDGSGTLVRWTYAFYPRAGRGWLVRMVLAPLWRAYARRMLAATLDYVETASSGTSRAASELTPVRGGLTFSTLPACGSQKR